MVIRKPRASATTRCRGGRDRPGHDLAVHRSCSAFSSMAGS